MDNLKVTKSCVIFACTILTENRLFVLEEFLNQFKKNFTDSDIYVGINPETVPTVEKLLQESDLNIIKVGRCTPELYTKSDASAYQLALQLLKESGNKYEYCWFVHTKGGVNSHSDYLRKWYIDNFLGSRYTIETLLSNNSGIGSYSMLGLEYDPLRTHSVPDIEIPIFSKDTTAELPYPHINFFYIHTLYLIRGCIIQKFLSLISEKWCTTKLDRYYFEGVFPLIVSRLGYYPYISNKRSMNGVDLSLAQSSWISDNNLVNYQEYLSLCKTDYQFDQLNPPYVSSNT